MQKSNVKCEMSYVKCQMPCEIWWDLSRSYYYALQIYSSTARRKSERINVLLHAIATFLQFTVMQWGEYKYCNCQVSVY